MKHLHLNNHTSSKQDVAQFANKVLTAIFEDKEGIITLSVDDGDGDVWKYEIHVYSERVKEVQQITEN